MHSKIDPEAAALHADLKPLLIQAKAGTLTTPIEVRRRAGTLSLYGEKPPAVSRLGKCIRGLFD
jgi:pectin methylesterase-like acyl-CoA thioesterase